MGGRVGWQRARNAGKTISSRERDGNNGIESDWENRE